MTCEPETLISDVDSVSAGFDKKSQEQSHELV